MSSLHVKQILERFVHDFDRQSLPQQPMYVCACVCVVVIRYAAYNRSFHQSMRVFVFAMGSESDLQLLFQFQYLCHVCFDIVNARLHY